MIDIGLATKLADAGLVWTPAVHDRFSIPGHDLDGRVFSLNDMSTEIRRFGDRSAIMFNGAVEWSLDWIMREKVVWLPSESQLRDLLGDRFVALDRDATGFTCKTTADSNGFAGDTASEAYALALLATL